MSSNGAALIGFKVWVTIVVIVVGALDGRVRAAELETITIYKAGRFNMGTAGILAAVEQGYFAEEGLSVDLRYGSVDGKHVLEQVKGQQGAYGITSSWALRDHVNGQDFVAFSAIHQSANVGLLVNPDAGIRSPADLAGRRVMMLKNSESCEVRAMILKSGLSEDQFELIKGTGGTSKFINGQFDAVMARYDPEVIKRLSKAETSWSMLMPSNYGVRFYRFVVVTSRDEVDRHPERVAALYRGMIRGYQYAWTHSAEIIDLYIELRASEESEEIVDRNDLESQALQNLSHINLDNMGKIDPVRWREIADTFVALGEAEPVASLDRFLFDPDPEPNLAWVAWVIGSAVGMGLLAIGVLVWNRQLRARVRRRTESLEQSERRRTLMMQELDHRVKNNLAVVLSLSTQTLEASDSLSAFSETLSGRLIAMARSHEALAADAWAGVELSRAAQLALGPYMNTEATGTVDISGPSLRLPARASIPLSMALHELSTNAAKYGALSPRAEGGRVALSWRVNDDQTVTILWEESGAPTMASPIEPGVGTVLIKELLEYDLRGGVDLAFLPEGLRCEIRFSLTVEHDGLPAAAPSAPDTTERVRKDSKKTVVAQRQGVRMHPHDPGVAPW